MAQNTNQPPVQEFKNNGEDFLHLKNPQGTVLGGIDNNGVGFGTLAGGGPATKTLYVDGNRTDSYTQNGAIGTPFKTIMAAVNQVIANGDNALSVPYVISIATGVYSETIQIESLNLVSLALVASNAGAIYGGAQGSPNAAGVTVTGSNLLKSTINNDNLQILIFVGINFSGVGGSSMTFVAHGNFGLVSAPTFERCTFNLGTSPAGFNYTGGPNDQANFYDCAFSCDITISAATIGFNVFGNRAIATGGTVSLTNGSVFQLARGARCGATVNINDTSLYLLAQARQDGNVVLQNPSGGGPSFSNREGIVGGNITISNPGTYTERGGYHEGTITINAGGSYVQLGTVGAGGLVLGASAPTAPSGSVALGNGTAATATAGAGSLPAAPDSFLVINVGGTTKKIPLYNN